MNLRKMKYFLVVVILLSFLFTNCAWAGLVPCGRNAGENSPESQPCTLCHLVVGFWGLINYGLWIMIFFAITGIAIAGVMYILSGGNEKMISQAKSFIKNVLFGCGFVLGAWLIVFTFMNYLGVKSDLGIEKTSWNEFTCDTTSHFGELYEQAMTGTSTPATTTSPAPSKIKVNVTTDCSALASQGAKCTSECPWYYAIENAICAGGEYCCDLTYYQYMAGNNYKEPRPYCVAMGGTCRLDKTGCESGETENKDYDCPVSNVCCFKNNQTPTPLQVKTCESIGGVCATLKSCPSFYQKDAHCLGYPPRTAVCCVGYGKAEPAQKP